jgi:hypothetical protein
VSDQVPHPVSVPSIPRLSYYGRVVIIGFIVGEEAFGDRTQNPPRRHG